jgi:hypothetical protein
MKNKIHLKVVLLGTLALCASSIANAGDGHSHSASDHGHEHATQPKVVGPNAGRIVASVDPHLEFFVTTDRFVQITFIDHDGKFVPATDQQVFLIGGDRSAPVKIEFVKSEGMLRSTEALPEMKSMPIVLQIKATGTAKTIREKFYLSMNQCPSCSFKEYACVCGH